jgi:hypothetical protein
MPIYRLPQQGFVVQPRILAKTVNIERGIVRVMDGHVIIEPSVSTATRSSSERRTSISQERLLESLAEQNPRLPDALRRFLDRAAELGVASDMATKSLQIRWRSPAGTRFALGGVSDKGEFITYSVNWVPDSIGRIDLAHEYLEQIAELIGGVVRKDNKPALWYVAIDGKKPPSATAILELQDAWLEIIKLYTEKLTTALAQNDSE